LPYTIAGSRIASSSSLDSPGGRIAGVSLSVSISKAPARAAVKSRHGCHSG